MYGNTRFLYDNKITTAGMLTPSSQADGVITGAAKQGTGAAAMNTGGAYSGQSTLIYTVQIDDVTGGNEIGQATFRWRTSDTTAGAWEAESVTTATAMTALSNGVEIGFVAGSDDDFDGNELWTFYAYPSFGAEKLLDRDRGTGWRSATDDIENVTLTIDLGAAVNITACVLFDHNLMAGATVTLKANTTDAWGSPAYTQVLTIADAIITYLDQTYRYWQIEIDDAANPDAYLEIGELFLGAYLELETNAEWGAEQNRVWRTQENTTGWGVRQQYAHTRQDAWILNYPNLSNTDMTALQTMYAAIYNTTTGVVTPLFLHLFSDEVDVFLVTPTEPELPRAYAYYPRNATTLNFTEVVAPYV